MKIRTIGLKDNVFSLRYLLFITVILFIKPNIFGQDSHENIEAGNLNNVLFIMVDDLFNNFNVYGLKTPNINKLISRGMLFDRAYAQAPLCNPSRSSILTGKRPNNLKIWSNAPHFRGIHPRIKTLPEVFKDEGYTTVGLGKIFHNWGQALKGDPKSWSRPEMYHWAAHSQDWYIPGRPFEIHGDIPKGAAVQMEDVPDEAYLDGRIANEAINTLRNLRETPFFLAVGFWKPHLPYNAPKKYWDYYDRSKLPSLLYTDEINSISDWNYIDSNEARSYSDVPKNGPISDNKKMELRHGYYAAISFLDAQIGKIIDELENLDLMDKTTIVFLSDHGYHAGEHGQFGKWTNFEIGTRVPLVIYSPNLTKPGSKSSSIVELIDLFPTLVEIADIDIENLSQKLDGNSLVPVFENPKKEIKKIAVSQIPRPLGSEANFSMIGSTIRDKDYRYVQWKSVNNDSIIAEELYNLKQNLFKVNNIISDKREQRIVQGLKRSLNETLKVE